MSTVLAGDSLGGRKLRDGSTPTQPELPALALAQFRPLTRGACGPAVRELQRKLVLLKVPGALQAQASGPGVFGPLTQSAVIAFQQKHRIKPTGQVGQYTAAAIEKALAKLQRVQREPVQDRAERAPPPVCTPSFSGTRPAEGTDALQGPLTPPVTSRAADRSAQRYADVINQLAVGVNPRYARAGRAAGPTFVNDVTRAMGAEVPLRHANKELGASGMSDWLRIMGPQNGWKRVDARHAQGYANAGRPALATARSPSGEALLALVRPGNFTSAGPTVAFAGSKSFNHGHVSHAFGAVEPEYYVHA